MRETPMMARVAAAIMTELMAKMGIEMTIEKEEG